MNEAIMSSREMSGIKNLMSELGFYFESNLIKIDETFSVRKNTHLEYHPMLNIRAH